MNPNNDNESRPAEVTLESWKEIGAYLQRNAVTVRRWEKEEGLPVHRHSHKRGTSVYAYPSEIDAWRESRKALPEAPPPVGLWKSLIAPPRRFAFGATLALCLVMVGNGLRPQAAEAQGTAPAARQVWLTGDLDPAGSAPSFDGRHIGYTDWTTGDLGVRDLKTGTNRRLTNTGGWAKSGDYAEASAISPDGRSIAYLWFIEKENRNELRVMPIQGGAPRTIYRSSGPNDYPRPYGWTPEGKQILVVRTLADKSSQLALFGVADGSIKPIKSLGWQNPNAQISPDGRFIAYDQPVDEAGNRDILVLATDGSRETNVADGPANESRPIWTPDGKHLLFLTNRTGTPSLWAVPIAEGKASGTAVLVQPDMTRKQPLGITKDGVLYHVSRGAGGTNVYVADLGSTQTTPRIAVERFQNSNLGPSLSPDGKLLAYYSDRPGQGVVPVIRTLATGQDQDIRVQAQIGTPFGAGPAWLGDGDLLLLTREVQRPGPTFLRLRLADGNTEPLLHTGSLQGWAVAPDGKSIYYAEQDRETVSDTIGTRLVRFEFETKKETVLKRGAWVIEVAVSPDSRQVAYLVSSRGSQEKGGTDRSSQLEVMSTEGGASKVVYKDAIWLDGSRYNALTWDADGRSLIFARGGVSGNEGQVLWRVPVSGGRAEALGISRKGNIKSPKVEPGGKHLYFAGSEPQPSELWTLENFLPAGK